MPSIEVIGCTNPYATHLCVLSYALDRTEGPILELGAGWYSTPLFIATGREFDSYEQSRQWWSELTHLGRAVHWIASYEDIPIESGAWSLAFVDHSTERRARDLMRLANRAGVVVAHDTEDPRYGYELVSQHYRWRLDYATVRPWTSIFSNFADVSKWQIPTTT